MVPRVRVDFGESECQRPALKSWPRWMCSLSLSLSLCLSLSLSLSLSSSLISWGQMSGDLQGLVSQAGEDPSCWVLHHELNVGTEVYAKIEDGTCGRSCHGRQPPPGRCHGDTSSCGMGLWTIEERQEHEDQVTAGIRLPSSPVDVSKRASPASWAA